MEKQKNPEKQRKWQTGKGDQDQVGRFCLFPISPCHYPLVHPLVVLLLLSPSTFSRQSACEPVHQHQLFVAKKNGRRTKSCFYLESKRFAHNGRWRWRWRRGVCGVVGGVGVWGCGGRRAVLWSNCRGGCTARRLFLRKNPCTRRL